MSKKQHVIAQTNKSEYIGDIGNLISTPFVNPRLPFPHPVVTQSCNERAQLTHSMSQNVSENTASYISNSCSAMPGYNHKQKSSLPTKPVNTKSGSASADANLLVLTLMSTLPRKTQPNNSSFNPLKPVYIKNGPSSPNTNSRNSTSSSTSPGHIQTQHLSVKPNKTDKTKNSIGSANTNSRNFTSTATSSGQKHSMISSSKPTKPGKANNSSPSTNSNSQTSTFTSASSGQTRQQISSFKPTEPINTKNGSTSAKNYSQNSSSTPTSSRQTTSQNSSSKPTEPMNSKNCSASSNNNSQNSSSTPTSTGQTTPQNSAFKPTQPVNSRNGTASSNNNSQNSSSTPTSSRQTPPQNSAFKPTEPMNSKKCSASSNNNLQNSSSTPTSTGQTTPQNSAFKPTEPMNSKNCSASSNNNSENSSSTPTSSRQTPQNSAFKPTEPMNSKNCSASSNNNSQNSSSTPTTTGQKTPQNSAFKPTEPMNSKNCSASSNNNSQNSSSTPTTTGQKTPQNSAFKPTEPMNSKNCSASSNNNSQNSSSTPTSTGQTTPQNSAFKKEYTFDRSHALEKDHTLDQSDGSKGGHTSDKSVGLKEERTFDKSAASQGGHTINRSELKHGETLNESAKSKGIHISDKSAGLKEDHSFDKSDGSNDVHTSNNSAGSHEGHISGESAESELGHTFDKGIEMIVETEKPLDNTSCLRNNRITTTISLMDKEIKPQSTLRILVTSKGEPRPDFLLLRVSNSESSVIFHALIRSDSSQYHSYKCPVDILKTSLATVTVHGVQKSQENSNVWYNIVMGGKETVPIKGETVKNYLVMAIQPLDTYFGLHAHGPNQIPYHIDVVQSSPEKYMLTNIDHRSEHTDSLIIFLHQIYPPSSCMIIHRGSDETFPIPVYKPATEYKLQLFRVRTTQAIKNAYIGTSSSTVTSFTTYMTQREVMELYHKAVYFMCTLPPKFSNISVFYRNKSDEYYSRIMNTDGVMRKYIKNWGGDQASTLNGQIQGLFFSTYVHPVTHRPPDRSYFGSVRLHVPTYFLLNSNMNMYFSDFYCHTVNHKVQIVIAVRGSPSDHFCRQQLVLLNQYDNPFLVRHRFGLNEIVLVTLKVTVEVFYTEDVPIKALMYFGNVFFSRTEQIGKALTMVKGIPKNRYCRICNLDCFLLAHNML